MQYTTDIQPREAAGKTDAQIAAELVASGLTARAVPIAPLRRLLRDSQPQMLLAESPEGGWEGPLLDLSKTIEPEQLRTGLRKFVLHLCHRDSEELDLTDPTYAALCKSLTSALVQMGHVSQQVVDAIYELAGGELFANATAEQVGAARAAHIATEARNVLAAKLNSAYAAAINALDAGEDAAEIQADWSAAWGA